MNRSSSNSRPVSDDDDAAFLGAAAKAPVPPRVEEDVAPERPAFEFDYQPVEMQISKYGKGNADLAARQQQALNRRLEKQPNAIMIPGGRVSVVAYVPPHYRQKMNWWLAEPEKLLKNPRPRESGYVYAWPRKSDKDGKNNAETAGWIRGGMYRPVLKHELIPDRASGVTTHKGPEDKDGDARVYWRDCILVEVHPEMVAQQYDTPVREAMYRIAGERDKLAADVEQISGGTAELTEFALTAGSRE